MEKIARIVTLLKRNAENLSLVVLIAPPTNYLKPILDTGHFNQQGNNKLIVIDADLYRLKDKYNNKEYNIEWLSDYFSMDFFKKNGYKAIDLIICSSDNTLKDYKSLLDLLSPHGGAIMLKMSDQYNQIDSFWHQLSTERYMTVVNGDEGMIQHKQNIQNKEDQGLEKDKETIRVAVLVVGLTRKFREASESFFSNFINQAPKNVQFDFFLNTWNIGGDYQYEGKNFKKPIHLNWIKEKDLAITDLEDLTKIYQPKILEIDNFSAWKQDNADKFNAFLAEHRIEDEPLRIFNGIFAQYYQVWRGFLAMEAYLLNNHTKTKYDLVIRTRYDLQVENPVTIDWNELVDIGKHKIISLEKWDRNGFRGNWVAGSWELMKKYSELWTYLDKITYAQTKKIKLASIHVPKYIFNYFFADKDLDPETMKKEDIFSRAFPYMESYVNAFIKDIDHVTFHVSLIPEIFLQFYLEQIRGIEVHLQEFLKVRVYPDFENIKEKGKITEVAFNRTIT